MPDYRKLLSGFENHIDFHYDESLKNHSSFKIGGPADVYAEVHESFALIGLVDFLNDNNIRYRIAGNSTNVLYDDDGFRGVIISLSELNGIEVKGNSIYADAGASVMRIAVVARDSSLSGMENLYGIPGSLGGAVYMNAGAYGTEMKDIVTMTNYYDVSDRVMRKYVADDHHFSYRYSIFRESSNIIISSVLSLNKGDKNEITRLMNENKAKRAEKQPLEYPSAGSAFKRYPGRYTAQMIEEAGLKGYSIGGAQVSEKHAGFIINKGNATARDVLDLTEVIQSEILRKFGVEIEPEIIYVR